MDRLNAELASRDFQPGNEATAATLHLATRARFFVRANIQPHKARQLAVGPGGTLTAVGILPSPFDLGGGTLGLSNMPISPSFTVRYSSSGSHLWSRTFDPDLRLSFVGAQPDGSVVLGGISTGPVDLEGRTFPSNGSSDLFYLQLRP